MEYQPPQTTFSLCFKRSIIIFCRKIDTFFDSLFPQYIGKLSLFQYKASTTVVGRPLLTISPASIPLKFTPRNENLETWQMNPYKQSLSNSIIEEFLHGVDMIHPLIKIMTPFGIKDFGNGMRKEWNQIFRHNLCQPESH